MCQFESAATYIFLRFNQCKIVSVPDPFTGFSDKLPVDSRQARHDGALGFLAAIAKAPSYQGLIHSNHDEVDIKISTPKYQI
jgi:hypothetical protein